MILLPFDPHPTPHNSIGPGSIMTFYRPAPTTFLLPGSPRTTMFMAWAGPFRPTLHHPCTPTSQNYQHSITSALPHLKTINTRALLHAHISKRSTLNHFCTPTSQNDRHSITFTFPHLKTINTQFLLHSHILIRAASFVLAVNTGHILVLRRKTCALLRAKTSVLLRRKTCAVLRARTCALFRANTKETTDGGGRPKAAPLCAPECQNL